MDTLSLFYEYLYAYNYNNIVLMQIAYIYYRKFQYLHSSEQLPCIQCVCRSEVLDSYIAAVYDKKNLELESQLNLNW